MSLPSDVLAAAQKGDLGDHTVTLAEIRPWRGGITVWIFEHGFIVADKHGTKLYPWVRCRLRYGKTTGGGGTTVTITVRHDDGAEFRLSQGVNRDVDAFLDHAIDGVTAARLPRAYEALVNRERLDFGAIALDLDGYHLKGKSVRWVETESWDLHQGSLTFRRPGKWGMTPVPASTVTDLHVLLTVIARIPAAPGRRAWSVDNVRTRKWAQAVVAERLGEDDFDWRDGGPLGRVPTINDSGRRRIAQVTGSTVNTRGEQILADAAHANWGVGEGVHYRALKKRVIVAEGPASEQILRAGEITTWRGLVHALSARHGFAIWE